MENTRMMKVNVDGVEYIYPKGTLYQAIAADFQEGYAHDILLVNRNWNLCELHKALDRDCTLKMITVEEKPGMQTYERSVVFLMLKAFYDVVRKENVERVSVEYSISHALFIRAKGAFTLGQELLNQVEGRMRAISEQAVPIRKESINTDDAVELFRFLYKGIIIKHNKTEPTYTKTSLFLCEKRRFFMARTEKGVVATI